ncbi:MAG: Rieske (2Fe-2S) protein [Gemmatimonadaceae bacterium]
MRLDRRGFLTQSMLVAAAAALAACGAGGFESITAPASINSTVNLSSYPALATVGGIALTSINGAALALVRTGATSFVALSRACPHEGTTLGTNSSGGFTCPRHGARFNDSGTWIGGQRTTGMHSYPVTYDATAGTLAIG